MLTIFWRRDKCNFSVMDRSRVAKYSVPMMATALGDMPAGVGDRD